MHHATMKPAQGASFVANAAALGISIGLAFGAAAFGAQFGTGEWYANLTKPPFNPPNWIFGPVWTLLYTAMAVAAWLVWCRRATHAVALPLALYALQLLLNAVWSWLFFGLHQMGLAFPDILLLDAVVLATLVLFWRIHRVAGALFVPYLAWISFASLLNFSLWWLNT